ncbi:MAG: HAMP domain-containing protein [Deltaproteobacteria bacterium]|nr:HAMP domain-containing protein [Deltaproteobacteria bacterium]
MRVPLHLSLGASYLFVVAIVLLPTILYVGTVQRRSAREATVTELSHEALKLADGLSRVESERLPEAARLLVDTTHRRLTVMAADGRVLADSAGTVLENHMGRPEVRSALTATIGLGLDERLSSTTKEVMSYAAARFPLVGRPRGVVRISVPVAEIESRARSSTRFVSGLGAFALTAAVMFSLVAALAISRPLRRMVAGARAFSQGEFGYDLGYMRNDELGDVARALSDLASQLRSRLLVSGADRAALLAFVNDLPVGVILFDRSGAPILINGRARELCLLTAQNEAQSAHLLYELPGQADVIERVKRDGFTLEAPLRIPWISDRSLRARWVGLAASDGSRQLALVVLEDAVPQLEQLSQTLLHAGAALANTHPELARELEKIGSSPSRERPVLVHPSDVQTAVLGDLCERAAQAARSEHASGPALAIELPDPKVRVVEAEGRVFRALRDLFVGAAKAAVDQKSIAIHADAQASSIRMWVRTRDNCQGLDNLARSLHALGGDAGVVERGDLSETWVSIPLA